MTAPAFVSAYVAEQRDALALAFAALCVAAGAVVMGFYEAGCDMRFKGDGSPVSAADEAAEAFILARLRNIVPGLPVIAEEAAAAGHIPAAASTFVLVDPLDGTREFISRNGEFTVNIALIENGAPIAGAVYAPVLAALWHGGAKAQGATVAPGARLAGASEHRTLHVRPTPAEGMTALASRSHGDKRTEAFLAGLPIRERIAAGSSLKFCRIAEGGADVYPRFGPTMEWDTAAGDAVLRAAGGITCTPEGTPLRYGKAGDGYRNGAFVAWGDAAFAMVTKS